MKNIMLMIILCSTYGLNSFVFILFMYKFLTLKSNVPKIILPGLWSIAYILVLIKQYISFNVNTVVGDLLNLSFIIIVFLYLIICSKLFFNGSLSKRIFVLGLMYILSVFTDIISFAVCSICFHASIEKFSVLGYPNAIATIMSVTLQIVIALYGSRFNKSSRNFWGVIKNYKEMSFLIVFNALLSIPSILLFNNRSARISIVLTVAVLQITIGTLCSIYSVFLYIKKSKSENEYKLKMIELDKDYQLNEHISENLNSLRQLRHDMRSHFQYIKSLSQEGKNDLLNKYIDSICLDIEKTKDILTLNNKLLCVIIHEKKKLAKEKNIQFETIITMENFGMQDIDLNSLLSNILNNAIEAAEKVSISNSRYINFSVNWINEHQYCIECENSIKTKPYINRRGELVTSKSNKTEHGLGLSIIRKISKKYDGYTEIDFDEQYFLIRVVIPLSKKEGASHEYSHSG
ncbi:sensor histidine kinase [Anaeromicropila populeti]|uniref:GHKL domain-containing protein n=1 Tax=Anaeromicropila populeti TaxID=37658 RepID=A0A1I6JH52_9FIRM|nr:GHKL domain-containing protein [Anaeromicropila populeti]SFR78189.1 GHKL domain-containing protein [Anaeromicropila populeti]